MTDNAILIICIVVAFIAYAITAYKTSREGRVTDQYLSVGAFLSAGVAIFAALVCFGILMFIKYLMN
jgi:hypothetical protein